MAMRRELANKCLAFSLNFKIMKYNSTLTEDLEYMEQSYI